MKKLVLLIVVLVIGAGIYVIFFSDLFKPTTTFGEVIDHDQTDEMTIQNHDTLKAATIQDEALIDSILDGVDDMTLKEASEPHIENHDYVVHLDTDQADKYAIYAGDDFIYYYGNGSGGYTVEGQNKLVENIDDKEGDIEWE